MSGRALLLRATASLLAPALLGVALGGCAADDPPAPATDPGPTVRTLAPLAAPTSGPPAGRLVADLRQSSRDSALGRFQVWVGNGLGRTVRPARLRYHDARLRAPIRAERLRQIPAGSERGFPLAQPERPACRRADDASAAAILEVRYAGRTVTVPIEDEADVVARYVAARCLEREVARVARLAFADEVRVDHRGEGAVGTLVLVVTPVGGPGHALRVETVGGTPVLTPYGRAVWRPAAVVRGDGRPVRLELPVRPARCDGHAFGESGGATAFRVGVRLDGRPGELLVRMGPRGAADALAFARESCGLGDDS